MPFALFAAGLSAYLTSVRREERPMMKLISLLVASSVLVAAFAPIAYTYASLA